MLESEVSIMYTRNATKHIAVTGDLYAPIGHISDIRVLRPWATFRRRKPT